MKPISLIPQKTKIDFMGKKWIAFSLSIILTIVTLASLGINGLNFGIDFTGGIVIEARTEKPADLSKIREVLNSAELGEIALQKFGSDLDLMIRIGYQKGGQKEQEKAVAKVKEIIGNNFDLQIEYRKVDYVGPQVGKELVTAGALSIILAFIGIMIYIWFRFEWQYGVGGILALIHDAMLTIGLFTIFQIEFNLTSVAAILTIIGYSINDSVVIYDRIRENMRKFKKMPMDELINLSTNETLSRTIMTAGTTLLASLALVIFGGEVIKGFSIAMLFGVIAGTYSSIYISAPILIFFNLRNDNNK